MRIRNIILIFSASYLATLLRFYINNIFIVSNIGSFLFGFVIAKSLSKNVNKILLCGFCSCFTSFTGFIYFLHELSNLENILETFIYLNFIIISNLMLMSFGFSVGRKK